MDETMQQKIERLCENIIDIMKNQGGSISLDKEKLNLVDNDPNLLIRVGRLMISYGLSLPPRINYESIYILTEKGWSFESFGQERLVRANRKQLEEDQIQSVIDTNKSIQTLNTKTEIFYTKQKKFNDTYKLLTFVIFLATAVSAVVATCNYTDHKNFDGYKLEDTLYNNKRLQELENKLKSQIEKDSAFQRKDSSKK